MKKCEYFQDLILTDFIDGELDKASLKTVEDHLLDCGACRAFLKEVKTTAALPFQQLSPQPVPAELWDAIKENIDHENERTNPWSEFVDRLKGMVVYPRLVPVFASLALMLTVGSVAFNTIQVQQARDRDQGEYLVSLLSSTSAQESIDQGTPIEHYFL